jgi:PAS domain-containing protein
MCRSLAVDPRHRRQGRDVFIGMRGKVVTQAPNLMAVDAVLRKAFESVPFGIALFDRDNQLVLANSAYRELLELPESQLPVGTSVRDLFELLTIRGEFLGDRGNDQARQRIHSILHGEQFSMERVRPNGSWIELRHVTLPGGGFVHIYQDITSQIERRWRAEGALLDLKTRVRELEERLAQAGT